MTTDQTTPTQPPDNRPSRWHTFARHAVLVLPLILVNSAAIYGQIQWATDHLTDGRILPAILFALTLESIAVYLAFEAHSALIAGDASGRLRLASYLAAGIVGSLNYSHFAGDDLQPTTAAIAFGMLSTISPWLWSIRSRSMRRDQLRAAGLVDPRTAHFSTAKWIHFPVRTLRAFRWAVDHGEQTERVAWEASQHSRRAALDPTPDPTPNRRQTTIPAGTDIAVERIPGSTQHDPTPAHTGPVPSFASNADAVKHAFDAVGSTDVPAALAWLRARGVTVNRSYAYEVRRKLAEQRPALVAVNGNGQGR